jgi:hypothetical protein
MKKRRGQRCTANDRKGSRCGKWCAPGEVVCAMHQPNRPPTPIEPDSDDVVDLIRRLTRDKDSSIRLRAAEALIRMKERQSDCAVCAANRDRLHASEEFYARMTDEQRRGLDELNKEVAAILAALRAVVMTQPRRDPLGEDEAQMAKTPDPVAEALPTSEVAPEQENDDEPEETEGPEVVEVEEADGSISYFEIEEVDD